jgi:hypothetical protein
MVGAAFAEGRVMITGDEKGGVWLAKNGKRLNRDTGEFDISGPTVELMDWLASPDGGALRMDQAIHVAREIAHGRVPHVGMDRTVVEIEFPPAVMTVDGGRTWKTISSVTVPAGFASDEEAIIVSSTVTKRKIGDDE